MLPLAAYKIKAILEGGLSLLPGSGRLFDHRTRGSDSARYCYAVWLRHLVKTHTFRKSSFGGVVVELGPGDSLGIGLAALLSGAERYIAVDVVRHADPQRNIRVLEQLVALFADRASIPGNQEFPEVKPHIDHLQFPVSILDTRVMQRSLSTRRLQEIADCLEDVTRGEPPIRYVDPVAASTLIASGSVDMLFSQAVLEHVEDLPDVFRSCQIWLKPHGLVSHQIDFRSHGSSREWNGHWAYPDLMWRLIRGNRPYFLNREPCSTHLRLLAENGFQLLVEERYQLPSRLQRSQLADRFQDMPQGDLTTAGVYVVAEKHRELNFASSK